MKIKELLSPVGSFDSLISAVQNGADAVYFGAKNFNARDFADNFDDKLLQKAIEYAKIRNVKTYLTLNTLIKDSEIIKALDLVNTAYSYGIDAIIIQDLGLALQIRKYFPNLDLHASTQMALHNLEGVKFLENLGFKRVVLARELSIEEISYITKNTNIEIECFVHGALCVSFSGQCLFSSLIGQRSGNRGKCAQACRLSYTLLKDNTEIKNGYLLSPKDLCTIKYINDLKNANISSFKIEGRMKSPEYVALTTRLYRKAIDNIEITDEDILNLKQIFNRGDFTTNNLLKKQDIIYDIKPKNLGTYLGKIINFQKDTGISSIKLEQDISMGDGIETLNMECSTIITEILHDGKHLREAKKGQIVKIGRLKNIKPNLELYKTSSKSLNTSLAESYNGKEYKRINIPININILKEKQISLNINNEFDYISNIIPEESVNKPLTSDTIINQFSKTNDTPYTFDKYNINLDDDLFLPLSKINQIRTDALENFYNYKLLQIQRKKIDKNSYINDVNNTINNINSKNSNRKQVYVYLNEINENILSLNKVDGIYIPYRFFLNNKSYNLINKLCDKQNVFLALPNILKDNIFDKINIKYDNIKGIMISNISQINIAKKLNIPIHLDYTMNIFNTFTYEFLKENNIEKMCVSPELNESEINNMNNNIEVICYGRIKCMTINNCIIKDCNNCPNTNYLLKDRLNYTFPVITDNSNCTMNIYNSKILSYNPNKLNVTTIRLDFTNESIDNINETISMIKTGFNPQGDLYTNGHFKKEV